MKFATVSKGLVMGLALLMASSAFATTKGKLNLQAPATVNGTKLKAGDYKLEWDGSGPNVEVSIVQGKNVVAKVPAKIVELKTPALSDTAVVRTNDDGSRTLAGVQFENKKFALDMTDSGMAMEAAPGK
jgi:hypothetical protein